MVKPIIALLGLAGAGAVAYIVISRTGGGGSPAQFGGGGATKKQQVAMDSGEPIYTEETTTTYPEGYLGVSTPEYNIYIPPMPQLAIPDPIKTYTDYLGSQPTKKQVITGERAEMERSWEQYRAERGGGTPAPKGTPEYTMTLEEVESELSKISLGGFTPPYTTKKGG